MNIEEIVIVTFIIEIIELMLQYSATLKGSLFKIYSYYQKSPFIFFFSNIGYIWLLFISINYGVFNFAFVLAIILKSFDIFTKIHLIQKLFLKPDNSYINEISPVLESKTPFWVWLIGPLTYPYIVYVALS
jgi:hypothetical protein